MMKKFVIDLGRGLADFAAIATFLLVIVLGAVTLFSTGAFAAMIIWGAGFIIYAILFYSLYLLISINDNLTEINKKIPPKPDEPATIENTGLNGKTYKED